MGLDDWRISVSPPTVELDAPGTGIRMTYTEQAIDPDGYHDAGSREQGTRALLGKLDATLHRRRAA